MIHSQDWFISTTSCLFTWTWAIPGLFFLYFRLFFTVDSKQMFYIKVCQWLDSNRRPLVSEATALPTELQPITTNVYFTVFISELNLLLLNANSWKQVKRMFDKMSWSMEHIIRRRWTVWPDWAIYWTLGNFLKPLAAINLPKSPTFLGNFCIGVRIFNFSSEIIFGQLL